MDAYPGGPEPNRPLSLGYCLLSAVVGDLTIGALYWLVSIAGNIGNYGLGIFVFAPFFAGIAGSAVLGFKRRPLWNEALLASFFTVLFPSVALLFTQLEGVVCMVMAFPITYGLVIGGFAVGKLFFSGPDPRLMASSLALLPILLFVEGRATRPPAIERIETSFTIEASPESIWPYLQNLNSIQPSDSLLPKAGVAHPSSVRTAGSGMGSKRHCELTTGDMPERIDKWQPPYLLGFKVLSTPPSMHELNPFGEVHAAHLTGYFECLHGEFRLQRLGPHRTRVIGSSDVQHRFAPAWYWSMWTRSVVHSIHSAVLMEVKRRAERDDRRNL